MKKNTFKKRITATIMAMLMAVSMVSIKADAASVGTGLHQSGGEYVLYVWDKGNTNVLGKMRLSKGTSWVQNTFTADKKCGLVTVNVSERNSDFKPGSKNGLGKGEFYAVVKYTTYQPSRIYGSCTVDY